MAGTSAVLELVNRVFGAGIFVPFVWTWFVVLFMATGAEGHQARRGIINGLFIVLMTRYAPYVRIVVARVVDAQMREIDRRPALG